LRYTAPERARATSCCTATSTRCYRRPGSASSRSTGEGESAGDASRGRFQVQVDDALAVREAIDVPRVGLWGFSQGGWIAPLAASRSDRVAFVVGVASTGVTPSAQMMYATAQQLRLAGYSEDVVTRALDLRERFEDSVHDRPVDEEALRADLMAALDEEWFGLLWLPPTTLDKEGKRLWIEEMDFDPEPVFAGVRVPALLFFGESDSWSPVPASAETWKRAKPDAEVVVIPGAEHDMTLEDGTITPVYERRLLDWLRAR
jgi:pimeloyl-ACP methyl ester carboxylesterase